MPLDKDQLLKSKLISKEFIVEASHLCFVLMNAYMFTKVSVKKLHYSYSKNWRHYLIMTILNYNLLATFRKSNSLYLHITLSKSNKLRE